MLSSVNFSNLILLLIIVGCQLQGKGPTDPDKREVTQRDLYRTARSQQKMLLVDGWEDSTYAIKIRNLIEDFHSDRWAVIIKDHSEVSSEELASTPSMLIGSPDQNFWINELIKELPFSIIGGNIEVGDRSYSAQTHCAVLSFYPNPLNVKMPIGLFCSDSEALIWEQANNRISSLINRNWNYEIIKESRRILLGNLSQQPTTRWELDPLQQIELPLGVSQSWETNHFIFKSFDNSLNAETMQSFTIECLREMTAIEGFVGKQSEAPINYFLYPNTEIKGLMTGSTDQSHWDLEKNEIHTSFDDHFAKRYFGKENQLIIRQLLGGTTNDAFETGLAVYFSSKWQEQGYQYWAKQLIDGGNAMTLSQLLDPVIYANSSSIIREALSGSLVNFLIQKWGNELFLSNYKEWKPTGEEMDLLTIEWWSHVRSSINVYKPEAKTVLPYLKGFNFTHEGYQIFNGYGSKMAARSLDRVHELGSNAIAIVPYSWMGDPKIPTMFRFSQRSGSENDESVINTISSAKEKELYTLLKPHVWISNSWPGEVEMDSEADWEVFFQNYYQWISHYALMAEMHKVDALCIGVEFSKATLAQDKHWVKLIDRLRRIYHGNLTYAANWGEEFENLRFWDRLDFIGLNCYYPLSTNQNASQKELQQGFAAILERIENVKSMYDKPVVITEIGFRSVETPWIQPHEEAGEKKFDENAQAESYRAVFEILDNSPVVDGILWWKWPTNMRSGNIEDRRFVPTGKQAEEVIEKWFH